ncbi:MAG TPA: ATP-dependent RecD-like DNA helicase [Ruminococcaceae bacterium]|nr:ATP-dependent RecD-like DNA helicase [Oscillospiraceae bacterium]
MKEKIEGLIERITYKNETNGYTVASVRAGNSRVTVVGVMPFLSEGETACFEGEYTVHPTYGEQFSVSSFERKAPKTVGAILRYLSSGIIKGVGPATAERIVERFKDKSLEVISADPEQLALIKGISRDKALAISAEYNKQYGTRDIMLLLAPYEVTPEFCVAVFRKLGADATEIIKNNPYALCESDLGFSFEKAEKIAFDFGISADDEYRLLAGIEHILRRNLGNGHTCLPKEKLIAVAVKLLESDYHRIEDILDNAVDNMRLISRNSGDTVFYAIPEYIRAEEFIAAKLTSLLKTCEKIDAVSDLEIDYCENKINTKFEAVQRKAIKEAVENGVFILTGGPGTGKTTTINAIIGLFEHRGLKISLAAPTGRAAKRMSELTLREAKTVHRLLQVEWDNSDRPVFARNERNPLESDVVIIDEASMVDVLLFESLLKALRPMSRLIIVGDSKQLPSVSAGNVLYDILESGKFPSITLKKVFRQAKESAIINTAHAIINETPIDFSNKSSDFFFLPQNNAGDVVETVKTLCVKRLPDAYKLDPVKDIQVICPSKMYETGILNINNVLQSVLNPKSGNSPEIFNKGVAFRVNDKVMQIKNNYDIPLESDNGETSTGVFNGDVGFITEMDLRTGIIKVRFDDKTATYQPGNMNELELAYAITVHKSQGSEFPCVIIPAFNIPEKLKYRNLIYTGVTRAKRLLVIVGSRDVFCQMAANDKKTLRYTMLREFLYER